MSCEAVVGYGYRRVPKTVDERPYGRVLRWQDDNAVDLQVAAQVAPPPGGNDFEAEIDIAGSIYGVDINRRGDVIVEIDWDDTNTDSGTASQEQYLHTYGAGGVYNVEVTVTNIYGFCDSAIVEVTIVDP